MTARRPTAVHGAVAAAAAGSALMVCRPIFTSDFWLIRRTGRWIAENRAIPKVDPFSFTAGDNLWIEHKWLFDLVVHAVDAVAGVTGLVLMKVALTLTLLGLLLRTVRHDAARLETAVLFVLAVAALANRFTLRAHLAGYVCLAAMHLLLRRERGSLAGPIAVQVLWSNLHGSFILGPLLALACAVPRGPWKRLVVLLAASCINPFGPELLLAPVRHLVGGYSGAYHLAEWQALDLSGDRPWFGALMLAAGLSALPFVRAAIRREAALRDVLIVLGVGVLALKAGRFVLPFFVVFIPIAASHLPELQGRTAAMAAAAIGFVVLMLAGPSVPRLAGGSPFRIDPGRQPVAATEFLEAHGVRGNVFNSFDHGDYLAGRLHPQVRIYVNGRMDLYDPAVHDAYAAAFANPQAFPGSKALEDVDIVLLHHLSGGGAAVLGALLDSDGWACVFIGPQAAVLLRTDRPAHAEVVRRFRYRALRPTPDLSYLGGVPPTVGLVEARRLQKDAPTTPQGWLAEFRLHGPGDPQRACAALIAAVVRFPSDRQLARMATACGGRPPL